MTTDNLWRVGTRALVVVVALIALCLVAPIRYRRTTWCGFQARASRLTASGRAKEVHVSWTWVARSDEKMTQRLCASCHGDRVPETKTEHLHGVWLRVDAEPPPERVPQALMSALQQRWPQFDGWTVAELQTAVGASPVLVIRPHQHKGSRSPRNGG